MLPQRLVYLDTTSIVREIESGKSASDAYTILTDLTTKGYLQCYTSRFALMETLDLFKDDEYLRDQITNSTEPPRIVIRNYRQDRKLSETALKNASSKLESWRQRHVPHLVIIAELKFKDYLKEVDPLQLPYVLALNSSISAADALHFSYALLLGCELVLSDDTQFCNQINIGMSNPRSPLRKQAFQLLETITGNKEPETRKGKLNIPVKAVGFKSFIAMARRWRV